MKNIIYLSMLFSLNAFGFSDLAEVRSVEPHYKYIPAEQVCYVRDGNNLSGAIIGGAIGHQFGKGSGNDAMTVLGALAGSKKSQRVKCTFSPEKWVKDGYIVNWEYRGIFGSFISKEIPFTRNVDVDVIIREKYD